MPKPIDDTACNARHHSGTLCGAPSAPAAPFPICVKHLGEAFLFASDRMRSPLPAQEIQRRNQQALEKSNDGQVYYVRVGDLIKIGTTRQGVHDRLSDLPPSRHFLAAEPGGKDLERKRHAQFRRQRVYANREWFTPSPDLWEHIAALRSQHGEPHDPGAVAAS